MKTIKITLSVLCLLLFFNVGFSQKKKVAVVTFYVNKHIDFSELGGVGAAAAIASLAEDPNFDLTSVLNNFHDVFFDEYAKAFPFELLPEEKVIGNSDYIAYESRMGETEDTSRGKLFQSYITYEGYKPMIEVLGKKWRNELKMLEIFGDEVDGVMFVYLDYAFVQKTPITAGIRAYVRMKLWNKEGEKVFKLNEFGMSKKSVPIVAGIPVTKPDKVLPLCESATEKLVDDLAKRLPKIAKKVAKNL